MSIRVSLQIVATFCQGPVARPSAPVEPLCSWNDFDGFSDFSDAVCFEKPNGNHVFWVSFFFGCPHHNLTLKYIYIYNIIINNYDIYI